MFENIGEKIKALAQIACWIGILFCVVYGIIVMAAPYETMDSMEVRNAAAISGFCIIIFGSLASWIGSFLLYGLGQLIENSDIIVAELKSPKEIQQNNAGKDSL